MSNAHVHPVFQDLFASFGRAHEVASRISREIEAEFAGEPADCSCDRCEALMINGVYCHETGCPNTKKVKVDGEWVSPEDDTDDFEDFGNLSEEEDE